jgi:hypothetical protein
MCTVRECTSAGGIPTQAGGIKIEFTVLEASTMESRSSSWCKACIRPHSNGRR